MYRRMKSCGKKQENKVVYFINKHNRKLVLYSKVTIQVVSIVQVKNVKWQLVQWNYETTKQNCYKVVKKIPYYVELSSKDLKLRIEGIHYRQ